MRPLFALPRRQAGLEMVNSPISRLYRSPGNVRAALRWAEQIDIGADEARSERAGSLPGATARPNHGRVCQRYGGGAALAERSIEVLVVVACFACRSAGGDASSPCMATTAHLTIIATGTRYDASEQEWVS